MAYRQQDEDTICAISTPPGVGGIGVIRVSGPKALEKVRLIAPSLTKSIQSHSVYLTTVTDENQAALDESLITYFEKGRSYTGEETIEISYHGSPVIGRQILRTLQNFGVRHAEPGEFTYRAFISGNIDLVQAESVLALIESRSEASSKQAMRNLKGKLSGSVTEIEQELIMILANLEANLDFSEENLEVETKKSLVDRMQACSKQLQQLLAGYEKGRVLREGLRVVIYGEPNVGKSSLINTLLGEDRAIVSNQPGTTRDVIESDIMFDGNMIQLVDTAGVHDTDDEIEVQGIQRSLNEADAADLILHVYDASLENSDVSKKANTLNVFNKVDLVPNFVPPEGALAISAQTGLGIKELKNKIQEQCEDCAEFSSATAFQARHFELLKSSADYLEKGMQLLIDEQSPEFVISEVQFSLYALFEMLGKRFDDEVMDRVFKEFCIGK